LHASFDICGTSFDSRVDRKLFCQHLQEDIEPRLDRGGA